MKVHCVPGIEFAPLPVLKAIVIVMIMGRRCRERQRSEMSTRETLHLKRSQKPQRSQDLPHGINRCADTDRHGWRRLRQYRIRCCDLAIAEHFKCCCLENAFMYINILYDGALCSLCLQL